MLASPRVLSQDQALICYYRIGRLALAGAKALAWPKWIGHTILTAPILHAPSAVVAPSSESLLAPGIDHEEVGHSSSDHSSSGHSISGHSLSGHSPPDTIIADSSTPLRFVHPPLGRTSWCSDAYLCWRSALLSTMYPPTTFESPARDSSFESFARPSRKRCRSPATTVTSSIHATRALIPFRAHLLLPRKGFRDSISLEDSVKEDIDADVLEDVEVDATVVEVAVDRDVEADATAIEVALNRDVEARVDASIGVEVDVGVDVEDEVKDEVESNDRGTMDVGVDVVVGIDIPDDIEMRQRELEARSLIAGGERASLLEQVASLERINARLRGTVMMESARADRGLFTQVNKARVIMSSATSAVTYTSVYTDSEPGRAFWGADDEEISEGGIPRVIVLGYDGLPMQPVAPPSPDYIPGPEDPQTPPVPQDEDEREPMFVQAHGPDYLSEPICPEYIPLEDDHEFPAEEQPLPPVDSPTAESPGYVTESDPEEDPEEYEDDETEDGPVDYPMDGGDDRDDDDSDSSRDDADGEDEDDEDEEEEEHLALTDSAIVVPVDEPIFPPEGTEPVIPPPSTDITIGARITIQPQTSISLPPEAERLARCTVPPAHSSPPPVPSPLLPLSGCPTQIQSLRIASTQALIEPPRKRLYLSTLGSRYEVGESSTARPTRDPAEAVPEIAPMTVEEVNTRVTELAELHKHDTQDLYALLEDAQDSRSRISQRQDQMVETLRIIRDMRREMSDMHAELLALRGQQRRARKPRPEARIPDHQDDSRDAYSHI
ncbi:hypothetical protein Tco_0790142 [Tanacetum coccineum]